jgi:TctA family transporter
VCMGLALGILPGIGGVAGLALLLPFTYNIDAPAAFALLLGMGSTTTTADPISAILFGAPGHAASAATTLDGYPMTRRGEAGRALGASYMSALIGGLFGAALMGRSCWQSLYLASRWYPRCRATRHYAVSPPPVSA